jgi:hypothetical protein
MPGYLVAAQQPLNPFTPTTLVSSTTVGDAIVELSKKTVNVFASTAARTTAIPAPTNGMVTYLLDQNVVQSYNGTSWVEISGSSNPLFLVGT